MAKVNVNGEMFDIDVVVNLMDHDLAEEIHLSAESEQEFVNAYLKAHAEKFGEEFIVN